MSVEVDGGRIAARTTVWAAGVAASPAANGSARPGTNPAVSSSMTILAYPGAGVSSQSAEGCGLELDCHRIGTELWGHAGISKLWDDCLLAS
jgi:hypothetical protein